MQPLLSPLSTEFSSRWCFPFLKDFYGILMWKHTVTATHAAEASSFVWERHNWRTNDVVLSGFYVLCSPPITLCSVCSSWRWPYEDVISIIVTTMALSRTSVSPIAWETWCVLLALILFSRENDRRAFLAVFHCYMQGSLWLISFLLTGLKLLESISLRAEKPRSSVILMTGPQFQTFSPQEFICWVFRFLLPHSQALPGTIA